MYLQTAISLCVLLLIHIYLVKQCEIRTKIVKRAIQLTSFSYSVDFMINEEGEGAAGESILT